MTCHGILFDKGPVEPTRGPIDDAAKGSRKHPSFRLALILGEEDGERGALLSFVRKNSQADRRELLCGLPHTSRGCPFFVVFQFVAFAGIESHLHNCHRSFPGQRRTGHPTHTNWKLYLAPGPVA